MNCCHCHLKKVAVMISFLRENICESPLEIFVRALWKPKTSKQTKPGFPSR